MKIVAHTKYGKFETKPTPYSEEEYAKLYEFMNTVTDSKFLSLNTENGFIYLPQKIIQDTVFEIEK
jgi:hypothetical protein